MRCFDPRGHRPLTLWKLFLWFFITIALFFILISISGCYRIGQDDNKPRFETIKERPHVVRETVWIVFNYECEGFTDDEFRATVDEDVASLKLFGWRILHIRYCYRHKLVGGETIAFAVIYIEKIK